MQLHSLMGDTNKMCKQFFQKMRKTKRLLRENCFLSYGWHITCSISLSLFRPLPSLFICLYGKRAGLAHPFRSNSKMEKCSLESTLWQFTYIVHLLWSWYNVNPLFNCRLCIRIFIQKKCRIGFAHKCNKEKPEQYKISIS